MSNRLAGFALGGFLVSGAIGVSSIDAGFARQQAIGAFTGDTDIGTPLTIGRGSAVGATTLVNTLETISLRSNDRRVVHVVTQAGRIEAPN